MVFAFGFLLPINYIYAEEELSEIIVEFLNGSIIDLDAGTQMIRAAITINNYNPQDGYHYMEVIKLENNTLIKKSEILPSYIDDLTWGVQILHYLDPSATDEDLLGDYELTVYSEFGTANTVAPFSIIRSSITPIVPQSSGVLEITSEEDSEEELELEVVESESKIPDWIHDIFVWYAEGTISEDELLMALKFLVESDIIVLDS